MATNLGDFPIGYTAVLELGYYDTGYPATDPQYKIERSDPASGMVTVAEGDAAPLLSGPVPYSRALRAGFSTSVIGVHVVTMWTSAPGAVSLEGRFEMIDPSGGSSGENGAGRIIAVRAFEKPEVRHLVWCTSNGDVVARQNAS